MKPVTPCMHTKVHIELLQPNFSDSYMYVLIFNIIVCEVFIVKLSTLKPVDSFIIMRVCKHHNTCVCLCIFNFCTAVNTNLQCPNVGDFGVFVNVLS